MIHKNKSMLGPTGATGSTGATSSFSSPICYELRSMPDINRILRASHQLQFITVDTIRCYVYYGRDLNLRLEPTDQNLLLMFYRYRNGTWARIKCLNTCEIILPIITEKMGIMFSLIVGRGRTQNIAVSDRRIFDSAQYCTITKLMLLREITVQYLHHDLFAILFDFTE